MAAFDDYLNRTAKKIGSTVASSVISNSASPSVANYQAPETGNPTQPNTTVIPQTTTTNTVLGSGPEAPSEPGNYGYKPTTQFGQDYIDRISKTLSGNDPVVANAKASADTADSVSKYLARTTAKQTSNDAGYTPGTLQSQRVQDRNMASADTENLQRDNGVNQLQRDQSQSALTAANGIETDAKSYTENLIGSVKDPKFQAYLRQVQARGGNVQQAYDEGQTNGTVNADHASATPEAIKLQGFVDQVHTEHPDWNDAQVQSEAQKRYQGGNQAVNRPVTQATTTQTAADILSAINTGNYSGINWSDPNIIAAIGQAPTLTGGAITAAGDVQQYVASNAGKLITVNGAPYQVQSYLQPRIGVNHHLSGSTFTHHDIIQAKDPKTNKTVYIDPTTNKVSSEPAPNPTDRLANQKWLTTFQ